MDILLNLIWHIPFGGFLIALSYAIMGILMCCTVVLIPAGKAYFELASYFLAPFSRRLVDKEDYARLNGEEYSAGTYTTIIRVLYFPFGCIACISAIFLIVGQAISIIGIPCAMVWTKIFSSLFNPFNKVCVSKEIADEIEAMKGGNINESTSMNYTQAQHRQANIVRQYDMEKLQEIVANAQTYNPDLVKRCQEEIEIRTKAANLAEKAEATPYEELTKIVTDPATYAPEWIYACELQIAKINAAKEEERRKLIEEERLKEEAEEARKKAERQAWWNKNSKFVYAGCAAAIALAMVLFFTSDKWHFDQGMKAYYNDTDIQKAEKHLNKVTRENTVRHATAQYELFLIDLHHNSDTAKACERLKSIMGPDIWNLCHVAAGTYAQYKADGSMEPYIKKDVKYAAGTYMAANDPEMRIRAVKCYFDCGMYDEAKEAFIANSPYLSWDDLDKMKAERVMAMIYRYGLGETEADWEMGYNYMKSSFELAEGTDQEYAEYADLCVLNYLNSDMSSILQASELYKKAYDLADDSNPLKESYKERHEITSAVYAAYKKDRETPYYERTSTEWDSYTFNGGKYRGMYKRGFYESKADGWGIFSFDKEVRLSKWNGPNAVGRSLAVGYYGFRLGDGYGNKGHITKGMINWQGIVEVGTFNEWEHVKGDRYYIF